MKPLTGVWYLGVIGEDGRELTSPMNRQRRVAVKVVSSLEERLDGRSGELPPTPQKVWDAAFVAGHNTAHTLLTGDSA